VTTTPDSVAGRKGKEGRGKSTRLRSAGGNRKGGKQVEPGGSIKNRIQIPEKGWGENKTNRKQRNFKRKRERPNSVKYTEDGCFTTMR